MFVCNRPVLPVIFGVAGEEISVEEAAFFKKYPPAGFILFKRNISKEEKVRSLTTAMKEISEEESIPILIDEEGGDVSRIKDLEGAPIGRIVSEYENSASTIEEAASLCESSYKSIGEFLISLGVSVNCAPVLDVKGPDTYSSFKNRCFSSDSSTVSLLGAAAMRGLKTAGCVSVMKHLPGYGSSRSDSHLKSTVIDSLPDGHMFAFKRCSGEWQWGMSSHPIFLSIDKEHSATFSKIVVNEVIRRQIGFDGFLLTDDLCMGALHAYSMCDRIEMSLESGHDCALVCSGSLRDLEKAVEGIPFMSDRSVERMISV
ncbi:glycoside hydrolase family 3 N-terminal domain-containing protein [Candidatus Hydrogenosomobacter endosymbioticus]|uniref:beta-N-acetylhexosaminidase n=1 Tax=Candidatus Hydrogenosomobacter endosymbioticus TaxID=2558174 RepID=A0ABN6L225_9PROT|nr:glycoside hydrolase family 3 N-terminal domain-containing protein [Candidatus Hydrogenosomobacter endosymbioticus]BDB95884.1 glycosyl hydrolase [Candidatus Hydrogenosomobacter endosymbioticus]